MKNSWYAYISGDPLSTTSYRKITNGLTINCIGISQVCAVNLIGQKGAIPIGQFSADIIQNIVDTLGTGVVQNPKLVRFKNH